MTPSHELHASLPEMKEVLPMVKVWHVKAVDADVFPDGLTSMTNDGHLVVLDDRDRRIAIYAPGTWSRTKIEFSADS